jgi:porin
MDGIPNDPDHPRRTRIRFDDKDGAFNMVEVGWLPEAGNDQFKGHAKLAFGLWGYTVREDDQLDVANIDAGNSAGPARKRRSQGGYLLGERTFYRVDDDRFVSGFGRYSWTDGDSSPLKDALSLGIHVKGPLAARPDDILGLAWTRASLSSNFRQATRIYGDDLPTRSESAWELTYRAQLTPWLAIQPNAQWVRNPGGLVGPGNARLIGVRLDLVL